MDGWMDGFMMDGFMMDGWMECSPGCSVAIAHTETFTF